MKDGRGRRRLIFGFAILAIILLLIGIALSIALPITLNESKCLSMGMTFHAFLDVGTSTTSSTTDILHSTTR